MSMTLRKLTIDDCALALAMKRTFREGFFPSAQAAASFLQDERNCLFAAIDDGGIVAFAYGYELLRPDSRTMLYIHEFGVAAHRQRQGVGTALITALKKACAARGICRFFLFTAQSNTAANALYRKCGGETGWESHGNDTAYHFHTESREVSP